MFRRTAVSSQMVPFFKPAIQHLPATLALHLASRAVKCVGSCERVSFHCPNDGSGVSLQNALSTVSIQMMSSGGRVAVAADPNAACDTTVLGIRNGIVFIRSNSRADMAVDVQQDDVFAVLSSLAPPQVDTAIESLLCSLSRLTGIEQAAEDMLLESKATHGLALLVSIGSVPCCTAQPPEQFP